MALYRCTTCYSSQRRSEKTNTLKMVARSFLPRCIALQLRMQMTGECQFDLRNHTLECITSPKTIPQHFRGTRNVYSEIVKKIQNSTKYMNLNQIKSNALKNYSSFVLHTNKHSLYKLTSTAKILKFQHTLTWVNFHFRNIFFKREREMSASPQFPRKKCPFPLSLQSETGGGGGILALFAV